MTIQTKHDTLLRFERLETSFESLPFYLFIEMSSHFSHRKLKKEAELMQLETDEHYADDVSKCWSFLVNGEQFTVVLYLASGKFVL